MTEHSAVYQYSKRGEAVNNDHQKVYPGQGENVQLLGTHHSVEYTEEGKLLFYRKGDTTGHMLTLWPEQVKLLFNFMKQHGEKINE